MDLGRVSLHKMVSSLLARYFMEGWSLQSLSELRILTYQMKVESYIRNIRLWKSPEKS